MSFLGRPAPDFPPPERPPPLPPELGPGSPESQPPPPSSLIPPPPPPPPLPSSMVSSPPKPCSTTSVEYFSWPELSVHLRVCSEPDTYTFEPFFRYFSAMSAR